MNTTSIDPDVNGLSPSREELSRWWSQSLDSIENYAYRELSGDRFVQRVLGYLHERLPRCKATCPDQLRRWAFRQIDKEAARLVAGHAKKSRKNEKPLLCLEHQSQHEGVCSIPLKDSEGQWHIWKVPSDWFELIVERIWPVYVRKFENGKPYLARKKPVRHPGSTQQVVFPAHHAFLWFKYPNIDEEDIARSRAKNANWLDWTGDNLFVPAFDGLAMSDAEREFRIKQRVHESLYKQENFGGRYERVRVNIDRKLVEKWERILAEDDVKRDIWDVATQVDADLDLMDWYVDDNGERINLNKPTRPPGNDEEEENEAYVRSEIL